MEEKLEAGRDSERPHRDAESRWRTQGILGVSADRRLSRKEDSHLPTIPKNIWAQKLQAIKRHSNHAKPAAVAGTVGSYLEGMVALGAPGQACLHSPCTTQA